MKIKALSLWQPWAALIAAGAKRFETRSRLTRYLGPLLICSARKWNRELAKIERDLIAKGVNLAPWMRKLGMALCIVDVVECWSIRPEQMNSLSLPVQLRDHPSEREREYGNYASGRFAWELKNLRPLDALSFKVTGRQFLFDVEIDPQLLEAR